MKKTWHLGAFFVGLTLVSAEAKAQGLMFLGASNGSHRTVFNGDKGKMSWGLLLQDLEGTRHALLGMGYFQKKKGFEISLLPTLGIGAKGEHGFNPSAIIFREKKWLFDLQATYHVPFHRHGHKNWLVIGPVDSIWLVHPRFRIGVTGEIRHWRGHTTANIGPEFRFLVKKSQNFWATWDFKPTALQAGGPAGSQHFEVGFGFVWNPPKKEHH